MFLSFSFQFALHLHPWLSIGLPSSCICDQLKASNSGTSLQPVSSQHAMCEHEETLISEYLTNQMWGFFGQLSVFCFKQVIF